MTLTFVASIIGAFMLGGIFGVFWMAVFMLGAQSDGPEVRDSEFDTSINEWGYIGERRGAGEL